MSFLQSSLSTSKGWTTIYDKDFGTNQTLSGSGPFLINGNTWNIWNSANFNTTPSISSGILSTSSKSGYPWGFYIGGNGQPYFTLSLFPQIIPIIKEGMNIGLRIWTNISITATTTTQVGVLGFALNTVDTIHDVHRGFYQGSSGLTMKATAEGFYGFLTTGTLTTSNQTVVLEIPKISETKASYFYGSGTWPDYYNLQPGNDYSVTYSDNRNSFSSNYYNNSCIFLGTGADTVAVSSSFSRLRIDLRL